MRVVRYPVDALYPSPYDWVACEYLMDKVKVGVWKNIFWEDNLVQIVSPDQMTFTEYKEAWVNLTGEWRGLQERHTAMTQCPLLKVMYGVCELN